MTPLVLGLAIVDNLYGRETLHVAGRLLTAMMILWLPLACVVHFFGANVNGATNLKFKAFSCSVFLVLAVAFLWLVQTQDWSKY